MVGLSYKENKWLISREGEKKKESTGTVTDLWVTQDEALIVGQPVMVNDYHIYQPLRSGRIWHKVNF